MVVFIEIRGEATNYVQPLPFQQYHNFKYTCSVYDKLAQLNCREGSTGITCTTPKHISTCMSFNAEKIHPDFAQPFFTLLKKKFNANFSQKLPTQKDLLLLSDAIHVKLEKVEKTKKDITAQHLNSNNFFNTLPKEIVNIITEYTINGLNHT